MQEPCGERALASFPLLGAVQVAGKVEGKDDGEKSGWENAPPEGQDANGGIHGEKDCAERLVRHPRQLPSPVPEAKAQGHSGAEPRSSAVDSTGVTSEHRSGILPHNETSAQDPTL